MGIMKHSRRGATIYHSSERIYEVFLLTGMELLICAVREDIYIRASLNLYSENKNRTIKFTDWSQTVNRTSISCVHVILCKKNLLLWGCTCLVCSFKTVQALHDGLELLCDLWG